MGTCRGSSRRPGRPGGIRTRWIPLGTHLRSRSPREAGRANGCPGRFPLRGPAAAQPRTSAFCGSRRSSDAGGVTGRFSDSSCLCTPSPTAESAGAGAARDRYGVAADASSVASAPEVGCPHEGAQGQLLSDGLGQNPRLPLPDSRRSLATSRIPWLSTSLPSLPPHPPCHPTSPPPGISSLCRKSAGSCPEASAS